MSLLVSSFPPDCLTVCVLYISCAIFNSHAYFRAELYYLWYVRCLVCTLLEHEGLFNTREREREKFSLSFLPSTNGLFSYPRKCSLSFLLFLCFIPNFYLHFKSHVVIVSKISSIYTFFLNYRFSIF